MARTQKDHVWSLSKMRLPAKGSQRGLSSGNNTSTGRLIQRLESLVFFHLGADADVSISVTPTGLKASVGHSRVESFDLEISAQELSIMAEEPEKVEECFLALLVKNRRG